LGLDPVVAGGPPSLGDVGRCTLMAAAAARSSPLLPESDARSDRPAPPTVTVGVILSASAPAILNNAAAPFAAALQLGLLGHSGDSHAAARTRVAVFTAVNAVITFVANVVNFLIVVTMARVGQALGARDWARLEVYVRAVLLTAVAVGCTCAGALWFLRVPLLAALSLHDSSDGASGDENAGSLAAAYLPAAAARLPPQLVLKASSSVLVGYQRVRLASYINATLALADTLAFYVGLHVFALDLRALGLVLASTCATAALVALSALLCFPPDRSVNVCGACATPRAPDAAAAGAASLVGLACDSINVLIRSLLLSGSVLALTLCAAPLGTTALNAHAVVLQARSARRERAPRDTLRPPHPTLPRTRTRVAAAMDAHVVHRRRLRRRRHDARFQAPRRRAHAHAALPHRRPRRARPRHRPRRRRPALGAAPAPRSCVLTRPCHAARPPARRSLAAPLCPTARQRARLRVRRPAVRHVLVRCVPARRTPHAARRTPHARPPHFDPRLSPRLRRGDTRGPRTELRRPHPHSRPALVACPQCTCATPSPLACWPSLLPRLALSGRAITRSLACGLRRRASTRGVVPPRSCVSTASSGRRGPREARTTSCLPTRSLGWCTRRVETPPRPRHATTVARC
jgi:hypothetical protein